LRKFSRYQSKAWMKVIAKRRKYKNQARGEQNGNAKISKDSVLHIRRLDPAWRKWACKLYEISERHWYSIRARQKWRHI